MLSDLGQPSIGAFYPIPSFFHFNYCVFIDDFMLGRIVFLRFRRGMAFHAGVPSKPISLTELYSHCSIFDIISDSFCFFQCLSASVEISR